MKKVVFIAVGIILAICLLLGGFSAVTKWAFQWIKVEGSSMEPTYVVGETLRINKLTKSFKNGDVIVFTSSANNEPWIKRIIASEGQTINIDYASSKVYVDEVLLDEPYIKEKVIKVKGDVEFPLVVPKNHYFVMGDDRNNSEDSRRSRIGFVNKSQIIGKITGKKSK